MSLPWDINAPPHHALGDTSTRSRRVALSQVDNVVLLDGIALWDRLRAGRRYPSRNDISPRVFKPLLRNTALLRVIDAGRDYEYRIVGDAYVMAHGRSFQGKLWSENAAHGPGYHAYIKQIYDEVTHTGAIVATRGWIERGSDSKGQVWCEYVFLPLGEEEVDHILVFAAYVGREGVAHIEGSFGSSFDV